jgi:hypothetical protein
VCVVDVAPRGLRRPVVRRYEVRPVPLARPKRQEMWWCVLRTTVARAVREPCDGVTRLEDVWAAAAR